MARILANKVNVQPPAFPYNFGRIKDNTGSGDGTPVDEDVYGDMHQFYESILSVASVTPNDLEENGSNGYQYTQAILAIPKIQTDFFHKVGDSLQPPYQNSFVTSAIGGVDGANFKLLDRINGVSLKGAFQRAIELNSTTVFTLPVAYRPTNNKYLNIQMFNNGVFVNGVLTINATTGDVQVICNAGDGSTTAYYIIDGIQYSLD